MKARVKIPYYDTKLRRKGDIVEVKALNRFVEALPEDPKKSAEKSKRAKNVSKG